MKKSSLTAVTTRLSVILTAIRSLEDERLDEVIELLEKVPRCGSLAERVRKLKRRKRKIVRTARRFQRKVVPRILDLIEEFDPKVRRELEELVRQTDRALAARDYLAAYQNLVLLYNVWKVLVKKEPPFKDLLELLRPVKQAARSAVKCLRRR